MLRYFTSGESHGEALVAFYPDLPAGRHDRPGIVDPRTLAPQKALDAAAAMKIETDRAHFLSGVHHGKTIDLHRSDLANKDWQNWERSLPLKRATREA